MFKRTTIAIAAVFILLASTVSNSDPADEAPGKILLVGNSIIYYNNTPAILMEIAETNGKSLSVDMYARGGAQIADLARKSDFLAVLKNGDYDAVIFHDRGGNAICAAPEKDRDAPDCRRMIDSHQWLANLVTGSGATPYLLGTYQPSPAVNRALKAGEKFISDEIPANYINITDSWMTGLDALPDSAWLHDDGMHPGPTLSALIATRIYQALYNNLPDAGDIAISTPLFKRQDFPDFLPAEENINDEDERNTVISGEEYAELLSAID